MNIHIMNGAFGDMKNCAGIVEEIKTSPNGRKFIKFEGCSYLFKGFPSREITDRMKIPKDMISNIPWIIAQMPLCIKISFVWLALFMWLSTRRFLILFLWKYASTALSPVNKILLEQEEYCESVGEIHKTMSLMIGEVKNKEYRKIATTFKNLFCMALEHDTAYKFRIQDILPEFAKDKLEMNAIKETKRVLKLFADREISDRTAKRWRDLSKMVSVFFRIRVIRKTFVKFIAELDMDKIKLDEADWYFCLRRRMYKFGGIPVKQRLEEVKTIDEKKGHKIPIIIDDTGEVIYPNSPKWKELN